MTKLKPSNIFDYFAPTGNSTKIADFGISKKAIPVETIPTSNLVVPELPDGNKKDNTLLYIFGGIVAVIGIAYVVNYVYSKKE